MPVLGIFLFGQECSSIHVGSLYYKLKSINRWLILNERIKSFYNNILMFFTKDLIYISPHRAELQMPIHYWFDIMVRKY